MTAPPGNFADRPATSADLLGTPHDIAEPQHYTLISAIAAFTRIAVKLGVLDRERREFWRFFAQATAKHRDKFAESLRLAAMGYHFRKLSEAYGD